MSIAIDEDDVTVLQGDVREQLATLPEQSVDCIVTSQPLPTGPSVTHSCSPSTEPPNRLSPGRIVAMYRKPATENENRW